MSGSHEHGSIGVAPMLDIGGDVGAFIVELDHVPASGELEACPVGQPDRRFHTGVHLRPALRGHRAIAVYPSVPAGEYEILDGEGRVIGSVVVCGGRVSELRLVSEAGRP